MFLSFASCRLTSKVYFILFALNTFQYVLWYAIKFLKIKLKVKIRAIVCIEKTSLIIIFISYVVKSICNL